MLYLYQIANIRWIIEKAREFQKNIYFCFIDYAKAFDCVNHNKLWKILKEMGILRDEEGGDGRKLPIRSTCLQQDVKWLVVLLISDAQDVNLVLRLLSTVPFGGWRGLEGGGVWGGKMFRGGDTAPRRRLVCIPQEPSRWLLGGRHFSENAMAPHSSTLAWKIPWMEEPGRL